MWVWAVGDLLLAPGRRGENQCIIVDTPEIFGGWASRVLLVLDGGLPYCKRAVGGGGGKWRESYRSRGTCGLVPFFGRVFMICTGEGG